MINKKLELSKENGDIKELKISIKRVQKIDKT